MNELQVFNYNETPVRVIEQDGEPWWVLADVCRVLEIVNHKNVSARLDPDEKGVRQMDTLGGSQNMTIINESGLYKVILRSDKPEAKRFTRWVTHEVLPAIRKNGAYSMTPQRGLTKDDYLKAAQIIAGCRNERLPYVMHLLTDAGFTMPELEQAQQAKQAKEPLDLTIIDTLMREKRMSLNTLSEITNICKSALSYYRRGIHQPSPERYAIIIKALS